MLEMKYKDKGVRGETSLHLYWKKNEIENIMDSLLHGALRRVHLNLSMRNHAAVQETGPKVQHRFGEQGEREQEIRDINPIME